MRGTPAATRARSRQISGWNDTIVSHCRYYIHKYMYVLSVSHPARTTSFAVVRPRVVADINPCALSLQVALSVPQRAAEIGFGRPVSPEAP